jgi:sulfur carrier protein
MIEVILNGESRALPGATSVSHALQAWGYQCERIAVAINGEFVARTDYAQRLLDERDLVDVVAPMQGG